MNTSDSLILDFNNIRKYTMNILLGIFVISVLLITLLLLGYYLTPNNYMIYDYEKTKDNLKFIKEKEFILKKNENYKLSLELEPCTNNLFYNFDKETNLIISNIIKSQNITLSTNDLIKIRFNSEVNLINNSKEEIVVRMKIYSCQT